MNKLKKILCYVIPCFLVVAITLGVVLPLTINNSEEKQTSSVERALADETGAGTASKSEKGGAIYLEESSVYLMKGGTISGHKNTYGGAIFISKGATFTMEGGTITGCTAKYGGAIYVASGGTCIINGGKIVDNTAEVAPAIYVESGGKLSIIGDSELADNVVGKYIVFGPEEIVGATRSSIKLKTLEFGSYPQTYVGDEMNATLESWYSGKEVVKTYTIRRSIWSAYMYTDGNIYVRGKAIVDDGGSIYKDGAKAVNGKYTWFKVEPIKWYALYFGEWLTGEADLELMSEIVLASDIPFNESSDDGNSWETSYIRKWCNETFYKEAFDESEKNLIKQTTIGNNVTGDYYSETSDTKGKATIDRIYLKSVYEMEVFGSYGGAAATSDFAIANNVWLEPTDWGLPTTYRDDVTGCYWLRSAGARSDFACYIDASSTFDDYRGVAQTEIGFRPSLKLDI